MDQCWNMQQNLFPLCPAANILRIGLDFLLVTSFIILIMTSLKNTHLIILLSLITHNSSSLRVHFLGPGNSNPLRLDRRRTYKCRIRCNPPPENALFYAHLKCSNWPGIPRWCSYEDSCCCRCGYPLRYAVLFRYDFDFGNLLSPSVRLERLLIFLTYCSLMSCFPSSRYPSHSP